MEFVSTHHDKLLNGTGNNSSQFVSVCSTKATSIIFILYDLERATAHSRELVVERAAPFHELRTATFADDFLNPAFEPWWFTAKHWSIIRGWVIWGGADSKYWRQVIRKFSASFKRATAQGACSQGKTSNLYEPKHWPTFLAGWA